MRSSKCNCLQPHNFPFPLESTYLPQHSILEHVQLMFFLVRDQIPHQYKTTGKITVLYTSIVLFQDDKWEDKMIPEHILARVS